MSTILTNQTDDMPYSLTTALPSQLEQVALMYRRCIDALDEAGIHQWDDRYPNRETFERSIAAGTLYVLWGEAELAGAVILDEHQASDWQAVNWRFQKSRTLVIHALAIDPLMQGRGLGKRMLEACEAHARRNGYEQIRLDVFSENPFA